MTPCEEKDYENDFFEIDDFRGGIARGTVRYSAEFCVSADGPPPFTFNDRCVPYEVDPISCAPTAWIPTKIISAFVGGGDGIGFPGDVPGTGNNGSNAPWRGDYTGGYDFAGNPVGDPVPCDEFHTNKRRTRYEGCHFYDGVPCYFVTTAQMDPQGFTPDEAGRRAFEIAEHFVLYEVTQLFEGPSLPPFDVDFPATPRFRWVLSRRRCSRTRMPAASRSGRRPRS